MIERQLPAPLTPLECDLRALPYFLMDVRWPLDSDFAIHASAAEFRANFMLILESWHQVPAASLPDDDRALALLAHTSVRRWRRLRQRALSEWVRCSDGRLYHPMVAERANAAWPKVQAIRRRTDRRLHILSEEWAAIRMRVFQRDDFTCTYCGASGVRLACDHVVPVVRGGATVEGNLTTACRPCNLSKGSKSLAEWLAAAPGKARLS